EGADARWRLSGANGSRTLFDWHDKHTHHRLLFAKYRVMRHRRTGRKLGRNPKHQRALLRSLASELILTERDPEHPLFDKTLSRNAPSPPRVRGRITTTLAKA